MPQSENSGDDSQVHAADSVSPPASETIISLENVTKRFPGVLALDNCRFDLRRGEVHALMGENGAGKSTLMKVLAGVYPKDSGEIRIEGLPVEIPTPRAAQMLGIGIIHQELNLMNHLTAAQNIFIGREPRGRYGLFLDEDALNRQTKAIFERMRLDLDPGTLVSELTVAKQQMVEIAKALSFDSRVLIMDEPTAALNNAEIEDLFRIIRQLQSHGVGIIYISHKMDELRQISNRVTVMRDGQYIATVPTATTSMETIIGMMVGRQLDNSGSEIPDTSGNDIVLQVKGLERGVTIKDVSFTLRKGEILGFAGLMGAGRTEVARAIFGADRLDAGEILVHGAKVSIKSPRDAVAHGIGYLSEDRKHFGLATGLDVKTNVALSSMNSFLKQGLFLDQAAIHDTAQGYVRKLGIKTPSVDQPVRLLSGGNQQKIVIAKWLLRDCDILFFDEPTRGIDVGAKSEIYKLLNTLAEQGKAIVMISSELPEVLRMSHRILVMCEGRITGELAAAEASQEKIMQLATQREAAVA
ncbi:monosaccharide ABC transporter ATP-binding protein, CUT2 family [Collimonas sp. OK307]|uniref:sugar ABC transporter ATP-binding protein n=1 Tax=Collimonas sp. OK307 TaxID=1801620 RepID=UPI0008E74DCB|nr:sugar ABC transporter ATP-binding protein [Collimonas sp. OK307]SFI46954.1 monosaccharide ABC transporter ATP-binding protein, CUT2 family [Collimonas sp. OK307]